MFVIFITKTVNSKYHSFKSVNNELDSNIRLNSRVGHPLNVSYKYVKYSVDLPAREISSFDARFDGW